MSKERELLRRISSHSGSVIPRHFIDEIRELLAQPEPDLVYDLQSWENGYAAGRSAENARLLAQPETEQTPDYYLWFDEVHEEHPTNEGDDDVMPLYLAPPKREPLSEAVIVEMFSDSSIAIHADSYWAGVSDAEKAHGIGVDDE